MGTLIHVAEAALAIFLLALFVGASRYQLFMTRCVDEMRTDVKVAAIVPVYNEDPRLLRLCLISLLRQTRPLDEVYVIDDGSTAPNGRHVAEAFAQIHPEIILHAFPQNLGKRKAQAWAVARTEAEIILTVDGDTILDKRCVEAGLTPFQREGVQGVCGRLRARNRRQNPLTWLADLQFAGTFDVKWAAYSLAGSVLSATGALSFWRTEVLSQNLDDYLGSPLEHGDDRRCTNYALRFGHVVYQATATGTTQVPVRLCDYLSQQSRWSKSVFPEARYALRQTRPTRAVWWLNLEESVLRIGLGACLTLGILMDPAASGRGLLGYYALALLVLSSISSDRRASPSLVQRLLLPLYCLADYLAWPSHLYNWLQPTSSWEADPTLAHNADVPSNDLLAVDARQLASDPIQHAESIYSCQLSGAMWFN